MGIATAANLIPYDRNNHSVLPLRPDDSVAILRDSVERQYRFQRPPTHKITAADAVSHSGIRYDSNQCWQYADDYQVGGRIDVYA